MYYINFLDYLSILSAIVVNNVNILILYPLQKKILKIAKKYNTKEVLKTTEYFSNDNLVPLLKNLVMPGNIIIVSIPIFYY